MGRTSDAKERLVESARELFHEHGYHAVGVSQICARAGVNKGSFYHFFPSKQELGLEMIDAVQSANRVFMEEALLGDAPPLERLADYFRRIYEHHRRTCDQTGVQTGCPLANLALEMSTQDPLMRSRLLQAFESQIGYLAQTLREAQRSGDLDESLDPRLAAETLLALVEGSIMFSKLRNDPEPLKRLETVAFRTLGLHGTPVPSSV